MKIASDRKEVEFGGVTYSISKLGRHILYCLNDGREISAKYTADQVYAEVAELAKDGLVVDNGTMDVTLTAVGDAVVLMLQDMH